MQTLAKSYFAASAQSFFTSSAVAKGLRIVWSMYLLRLAIRVLYPLFIILDLISGFPLRGSSAGRR